VAQTLPAIVNTSHPKLAAASNNTALPTDTAYVAALMTAPFVNELSAYLTQGVNNSIDRPKFSASGSIWLLANVRQQEQSA
jgi:hypothetical protein